MMMLIVCDSRMKISHLALMLSVEDTISELTPVEKQSIIGNILFQPIDRC